ncbi:hypothetical protein, partial [uncultured Xanthomonas sp.]|uniref:hypothetical protein n=1 Tax=uncultured Xanthomonas sp. TaxID=152831 RepID=UPI0025E08CE8
MISLRLLKAGMGIGGRCARNNIAIKLSDKRGCLPMKKIAAVCGRGFSPAGRCRASPSGVKPHPHKAALIL